VGGSCDQCRGEPPAPCGAYLGQHTRSSGQWSPDGGPWSPRMDLFGARVSRLLRRFHEPCVVVAPSLLHDAGLGVFVATPDPIPPGTPICLYPGERTPPLPPWAFSSSSGSPSPLLIRKPEEDNAYILNLASARAWPCPKRTGGAVVGGFLDAAPKALAELGLDALENPSAVGHRVNHCGVTLEPNVSITAFSYRDLAVAMLRNGSEASYEHFPPPNQFPMGPWYLDEDRGCTVDFPRTLTGDARENWLSAEHSERLALLAGAVVVSSRTLLPKEELLLDYDLSGPPFPRWAVPWYKSRRHDGDVGGR